MMNCGVLFEVRPELLKYYLDELRRQSVNQTGSNIEYDQLQQRARFP
jgi:hypothetical protein